MAKNKTIYSYAEDKVQPKVTSNKDAGDYVVPQIEKEAEQSVEEYKPPKINRRQLRHKERG